jgi:hypothetical protein
VGLMCQVSTNLDIHLKENYELCVWGNKKMFY